jgi:hypothetical protein
MIAHGETQTSIQRKRTSETLLKGVHIIGGAIVNPLQQIVVSFV